MEECKKYNIILHNDDIHSFPYVMACLIRMCEHTQQQAEQCALLVHLNGKCQISSGNFEDMLDLSINLSNLDLVISLNDNVLN